MYQWIVRLLISRESSVAKNWGELGMCDSQTKHIYFFRDRTADYIFSCPVGVRVLPIKPDIRCLSKKYPLKGSDEVAQGDGVDLIV